MATRPAPNQILRCAARSRCRCSRARVRRCSSWSPHARRSQASPSSRARTVRSSAPSSPSMGRVHLGYGDYNDNTGPIAMSAWDPLEAAFVDYGILPTEEVLWFRPGVGTLYSPAADPDGHQESGGIYRLDCGSEAWHVGTPIPGAVHVYDVARAGRLRDLHVGTGSLTGAPALLMASQDHGESWTEVLRRESDFQALNDRFSRFSATRFVRHSPAPPDAATTWPPIASTPAHSWPGTPSGPRSPAARPRWSHGGLTRTPGACSYSCAAPTAAPASSAPMI